ncbi:MAG: short-chain dehydrogenase/reductase SDR [Gammaproteobacteria bacterium]|nr:MAG: short-chain dehydrogenase/reductase SDR [Gammaproteobacteria bacterium]TND07272.1 MAG: short-chain dehydrogenase/reductase SDR [Gammaproteobacteria bacterium]
MQNLWNEIEAAGFQGDLQQRVYTSRLLGRDTTLVMHGGGNTSVKITEKNILGIEEALLYVKGSGWDLEFIEAAGFAPVRLDHLVKLAKLKELSDPEMVNELKTHMTNAAAPTPSVEAILHAVLPFKYVDHTHSDAVIAVTNTANGEQRIREIYGDSVLIVPYVMPGFDLARMCADLIERYLTDRMVGMVLLSHGIFSFGATARESYERMIELVGRAEYYLKHAQAWDVVQAEPPTDVPVHLQDIVRLRAGISQFAGGPVILSTQRDTKSRAFARHPDIARLSQQGPATPDHVIRTKRVPMLGLDVPGYAEQYKKYFDVNDKLSGVGKTMLDAAPRVVLDPALGMLTVGRTAKDAAIVRDIYDHTIDIILRATALGGYRALPEKDIFDVEYWDLEQAKLRKSGKPPAFTGEVVLISGAASGIGRACVDSFLARGAAVVGLDINDAVATLLDRPDYCGLICDVTDEASVQRALEQAVLRFGGLDMLVLNAGVFPPSCNIADLHYEEWWRVMNVNVDASLALMRLGHPLLKLAQNGGRVVVIGSKNVPAPGPGAAAYSASKAALNQLARVAALEWGRDNIRINTLHPNAVFDTGIWTSEVLETRAQSYGLTVDEYKTRNVLKVQVTSQDVAELAAEMCGPLFARTTGAQLPVDGGNERVI